MTTQDRPKCFQRYEICRLSKAYWRILVGIVKRALDMRLAWLLTACMITNDYSQLAMVNWLRSMAEVRGVQPCTMEIPTASQGYEVPVRGSIPISGPEVALSAHRAI